VRREAASMAEKEGNLEAVLKEAVDLVWLSSLPFLEKISLWLVARATSWEIKACAFLFFLGSFS
jgi:hypothetical protein